MERRKKEEAERKAKLDEIAERQRQRELELEEKDRKRKEELLGKSTALPARPTEPLSRPPETGATAPAAAAAAAASAPTKYVPKFKRGGMAEGAPQAPPPETDKWGGNRQDDRPSDRWGSRPADDRWRDRDDRDRERRPFGAGSRPGGTWSSSRTRGER